MPDEKKKDQKATENKRPFDTRGVSSDEWTLFGYESKDTVIENIKQSFNGQFFQIDTIGLRPRLAKKKVAAYCEIAVSELHFTLVGEPYTDYISDKICQGARSKSYGAGSKEFAKAESAVSQVKANSSGPKSKTKSLKSQVKSGVPQMLANAKMKPGFMTVAAGSAGLKPSEIRDKLLKNAKNNLRDFHGDDSEDKMSSYRELSADFGTVVHQLIQKEKLRNGSASEVEKKFYSQEGSIRGSADIVESNRAITEVKTVTSGIFNELTKKKQPYPTHLVQLNSYLLSLGKPTGKLVYVNRENLQQRLTFEFSANSELWERTKRNVERGQLLAMKSALKQGIPLSAFYSSEVYGPTEELPSDQELRGKYSSLLFKSLTTKRGMPSNLEALKEARSRRGSKTEGFRHGWFGSTRKDRTDFGSGFQTQEESQGWRPSRKTAVLVMAASMGTYAYLHPEKMMKGINYLEEHTPGQIFKTFRFGEKLQPWHIAKEGKAVNIEIADLLRVIKGDKTHEANLVAKAKRMIAAGEDIPENMLSDIGRHWKAALGGKLPINKESMALELVPKHGTLFSVKGTDRVVELVQADSRAAVQASVRSGISRRASQKSVEKAATKAWKKSEGVEGRLFGKKSPIIGKHGLFPAEKLGKKILGRLGDLEPGALYGKNPHTLVPVQFFESSGNVNKDAAKLAMHKLRSGVLGGYQRLNRLLNTVGIGLKSGTYDRVMTLPMHNTLAETGLGKALGLTKNIKGGLVNKLLMRRFLPGFAIYGGMQFLDYITGHRASNLPVDAYTRGKVAAAQASRALYFPRKYREMMENASPFPLYGPSIAFSVMGAGYGLFKANQVIRKGPSVTKGALKLMYGAEKVKGLSEFTHFAALPGASIGSRNVSKAYKMLRGGLMKKGAKIGFLASLPWLAAQLVPGKSPEEYNQIYSGQKLVPIKKSRFWESCLVKGSIVNTSRGFIPIEDVIPGDFILTHKARKAVVSDVSTHPEEVTYKLKASSFALEDIQTTPEHELYVYHDGKLKWMEVQDIEVGDKLAYPLPFRKDNIAGMLQYINTTSPTLTELDSGGYTWATRLYHTRANTLAHCGSKKVKVGRRGWIFTTFDAGLIFGTYLGDGNIFRAEGIPLGIEFAFGEAEIDKAIEVQKAVEKVFGLFAEVQKKGRMYRLRYMSAVLGEIFDNMFQGSAKHAPDWMYKCANTGFYKGLLSGLIDSDGTISGKSRLTFNNTNIEIVHLFWQACLYLDIYSKVVTKWSHHIEDNGYKLCYALYLSSEMSRRFKRKVESIKATKLKTTEYVSKEIASKYTSEDGIEYVLFEVISKERVEGQVDVYDICVEDEDHSFLGYAVAYHNSSTPFEGERVKGYRKHWVARFRNRDRIKEEYGSEGEYWKRSLKTPLGWFNLAVDPYGKEVKQASRGRRFPLTEELFTEIPFIGKTLGRWVGHTIKPQRYMYGKNAQDFADMYQSENPELEPSKTLGGLNPVKPSRSSKIGNIISDTANEALTQFGLPGWLTKLGVNATLSDKALQGDGKARLQTASEVGSPSRAFYGLEIGGGLFTSETVRRFIMSPSAEDRKTYNPLAAKNIPSWLSGPNDLVKYHFGDPYSKAFAGTAQWLPGPEYNKAHGLPEDLNPEDYPAMHKLAILSNLQPYSKKIPGLVKSLRKKGLSSEQEYFVSSVESQVKSLKTQEEFKERIFTNKLSKYSGTVAGSSGEFFRLNEYGDREFKVGGVDMSTAAIANNLMHQNVSRRKAVSRATSMQEEARRAIDKVLKDNKQVNILTEEGAPFYQNSAPAIVTAGGININEMLINKYNMPIDKNSPVAGQLYSRLEQSVGRFNEAISHDSPIPGINKFMGANNAIEKYQREQVYGRKIKLWNKPAEHFMKPALWSVKRRLNNAFNPISANDDDYNTIEGLKGTIHKQFGVFGSGFKGAGYLTGVIGARTSQAGRNVPFTSISGFSEGSFAESIRHATTPFGSAGAPGYNAGTTTANAQAAASAQGAASAVSDDTVELVKQLEKYKVKTQSGDLEYYHIKDNEGAKLAAKRINQGAHPIVVDTEAYGTGKFTDHGDPIWSDKLSSVQVYDEKAGGYVFEMNDIDPNEIKSIFEGNRTKVFHNASYDVHMLQSNYGVDFKKGTVQDTLATEALLENAKRTDPTQKLETSLEDAMKHHFNVNIAKDVRSDLAGVTPGKQMAPEMLDYAFLDTKYGYDVYKAQQAGRSEKQINRIVQNSTDLVEEIKQYSATKKKQLPYKLVIQRATKGSYDMIEDAAEVAKTTVKAESSAVGEIVEGAVEAVKKAKPAKVKAAEVTDSFITKSVGSHMKKVGIAAGIGLAALLVMGGSKKKKGESQEELGLAPSKSGYNPANGLVDWSKKSEENLNQFNSMGHGWFGSTRKERTNFGSGFSSMFGFSDDIAYAFMNYSRMKREQYRHRRQHEMADLQESIYSFKAMSKFKAMQGSKYVTVDWSNSSGGTHRFQEWTKKQDGMHPGNSGFGTAIIRETTPFGSGLFSPTNNDPVPGYTDKVRRIQEYFDKLSYMKYAKLEAKYEREGNDKKAAYYKVKKDSTMVGADPLSSEPEQLVSLLPKNERPYFMDFVNEADERKRSQILELVPSYEKRLLLGQWFRQSDKSGIANSASTLAAYMNYSRNKGYSIPDVSSAEEARQKELEGFFEGTGMAVPDDGWMGYDERVDMEDVKTQYLQRTGNDLHDFDIWNDRIAMLGRKPYLANITAPLVGDTVKAGSANSVRREMERLGMNNVAATRFPSGSEKINLTIRVDPDTIVQRSSLSDQLVQSLPKTRDNFDSVDFYTKNHTSASRRGHVRPRMTESEKRKALEYGVG